jgi:hypothetical protein
LERLDRPGGRCTRSVIIAVVLVITPMAEQMERRHLAENLARRHGDPALAGWFDPKRLHRVPRRRYGNRLWVTKRMNRVPVWLIAIGGMMLGAAIFAAGMYIGAAIVR